MATDGEDEVLRLIHRFGVELMRHHRHMAGSSGVGQTDLLALGILAVRGPMTVTALGRALELSSASATGLVDRLEGSGHLGRSRDPADRRRVLVHATDLAGQVARTALAGFLRELRQELQRCSAEELAGAAHVLRSALAALDAPPEASAPARRRD